MRVYTIGQKIIAESWLSCRLALAAYAVPAERDTTQRDRSRLKRDSSKGGRKPRDRGNETKRNEAKRSRWENARKEFLSPFFLVSRYYWRERERERRRRINEKSITVVGRERKGGKKKARGQEKERMAQRRVIGTESRRYTWGELGTSGFVGRWVDRERSVADRDRARQKRRQREEEVEARWDEVG